MAGISAFKKAAVAQPAKKKGGTPEASMPDLDNAVEAWLAADVAEKEAKAAKVAAESAILDPVEHERLKESLAAGSVHSSVKVNGKIIVSTKNAYSAVDPAVVPQLEEIFGEDSKKYFKEKMKIALNDKALNDEAIIKKLVDAVGEENINEYFDVKQVVEVSDSFHTDRSTDPKVASKAQAAIEQGMIRPYKAAVRRA